MKTMKNTKKMAALLLACVMVVSLFAGCGNTENPAQTTTAVTEAVQVTETTAEPASEEASSPARHVGVIADNGATVTVMDQLSRVVEVPKNPKHCRYPAPQHGYDAGAGSRRPYDWCHERL